MGNQMQVTTPSDREVVMTRVFDAPRDLVFEAHTSCEHMSHWWGPRRYVISECDIDFRPGGAYRIVQKGEDGAEYAFRGEFMEIERPDTPAVRAWYDRLRERPAFQKGVMVDFTELRHTI